MVKNIPLVSDFRYLGLKIANTLSWDKYIIEHCKSINWKVVQLKQMSKTGCSSNLLLQTYKTFIQQKFDYGISLWGCTSKKNIRKVQRIQNRAARIILNKHDRISVRGIDLIKELGIMNIEERRDYFLCKFTYESIHGLAPDYLVNNIEMRVDRHGYNFRGHRNDDVYLPTIKKEIFRMSLRYFGGKLWNRLPDHVKDSCSQDNFKLKYKRYRFPNCMNRGAVDDTVNT